MSKRVNISKKQLYNLYIKQKKSSGEIAQLYNCSRKTILNKLHKYNIKIRSRSEANLCKRKKEGGRYIDRYGYVHVYMPSHPYNVRGYVLEHRLVMEEHLGRYLRPEEVVHHKNGIKSDNRISNLQLFANRGEHKSHHLKQIHKLAKKYLNITAFVKLLDPSAKIPTKSYPDDAGYDLEAIRDTVIPARGVSEVETGIAIELPKYFYAEIHSRSGLRRKGIFVPTGIIDQNYRGDLRVIVYNFTDNDYIVKKGDRIAQLIIRPQVYCTLKEVDQLSPSDRGENGFGSTGR